MAGVFYVGFDGCSKLKPVVAAIPEKSPVAAENA
jgi:hypothetical protein